MTGALRDGLAVITGAGSGLGRALAVEFAHRQMTVVGFGRREGALRETAAMIEAGRFLPRVVDVADVVAVEAAFAGLDREERPVRVLVNNAAIHDRFDLLEAEPERFMHSIRINLGGVVNCSHSALRRMSRTGIGRIVNVGSFAHLAPQPCSSAYSVSKGAAQVLTKAMVADLEDRFPDIVITHWIPGILATSMGRPDGLDPAVAASWGAELALDADRSLNGAVFSGDLEYLPPRSLRQRVKDLVLLRRPTPPRRLAPPSSA